MAVLHIVNCSPEPSGVLSLCLERIVQGDALILIEGAVYAALRDSLAAEELARADCKRYVLGPDLEALGIAERPLLEGVSVVDFSGFVDLCAAHELNLFWS